MVEASHETGLGHPRKYSEGWEDANKQIYISNKPLLNGGDLEKYRVYPVMIQWHAIPPRFM